MQRGNIFLVLTQVLLTLRGLSGENENSVETETSPAEQVFQPSVSATCRAGIMTIRVETPSKFNGAVHTRDYRKSACTSYGLGGTETELNINMLTEKNSDGFCGVYINEKTEERSVAVAVRIHRTLELADDKFYIITCGKAGFQNTHNETSLVTLQLLREGRKVQQVVYGREYMLRAHISQPDGTFGMRVKRCFSFSDLNSTVELVDERGCPEPTIMSEFTYNRSSGAAEAKLFSMFKFPESNRVHFQCDILICKGDCPKPDCEEAFDSSLTPKARSLEDPVADALTQPVDTGALMASYSVFVVEPGTLPVEVESVCENCGVNPVWLLYLCIAFGILFLVMLVINLFLCTAMSCSCTKDTKGEKETSYLEDFDPYARPWHGSQYGSRYSLNGGIKTVPVPYLPADTARSVSSTSEYGVGGVTSRPNSRHSHRPRGPASTSGSNSGYSRQSSRGALVAK
ncbi:uncharacterized protein LOC111712591 isoform X2 [Eurytemora carolleeae]|uniref:uncharacterized protein LOC111712591 isoform X2 n=1 Tax=Eurytemora carolleeae TaxID=1294199 RepID=UPI000C78EAD3|nr:uncharacterized protein LOC111712591 isoform X2 [Eurytemora carolleeae]|eukprot:XP_023343014.1 uncharacterized protein LOC111712591 isoform X2 [Eurytemora affinis]